MSQLFIVPTNENGLILDTQIAADIRTALSPPFIFSDVYLYAHGWWTSPQRAMQEGELYPLAERMNLFKIFAAPRVALGFGGPTQTVENQFAPVAHVSVGPGFTAAALPPRDSYRMLVADLTPLHADPSSAPYTEPLAGHHSDIFRDEIYSLIAGVI